MLNKVLDPLASIINDSLTRATVHLPVPLWGQSGINGRYFDRACDPGEVTEGPVGSSRTINNNSKCLLGISKSHVLIHPTLEGGAFIILILQMREM
jgi:hypothetical protein